MNVESKEQLSALMDGEIDREAVRFVTNRVGSEGELRVTWSRYHRIRATLRREDAPLVPVGFADAVMARLDERPGASSQRFAPWLRYATGGAIAASVAVAALLVSAPQRGPLDAQPGSRAVVADQRPAPVTFNDSMLQPRPPMLAQPASATSSGWDSSGQVGFDPRGPSYLTRRADGSVVSNRVGAAPYVLLVVPTAERPSPAGKPGEAATPRTH